MRPLSTLLRSLGLLALVVGLVGPLSVAAQEGSPEAEMLAIGAVICDGPEPSGTGPSGISCEAFGDATVTVTDETGDVVGSC